MRAAAGGRLRAGSGGREGCPGKDVLAGRVSRRELRVQRRIDPKLRPPRMQVAALAWRQAPSGDHRHSGCGIPLLLCGPEPRPGVFVQWYVNACIGLLSFLYGAEPCPDGWRFWAASCQPLCRCPASQPALCSRPPATHLPPACHVRVRASSRLWCSACGATSRPSGACCPAQRRAAPLTPVSGLDWIGAWLKERVDWAGWVHTLSVRALPASASPPPLPVHPHLFVLAVWDTLSFASNGLVFFWAGIASINYLIRCACLVVCVIGSELACLPACSEEPAWGP